MAPTAYAASQLWTHGGVGRFSSPGRDSSGQPRKPNGHLPWEAVQACRGRRERSRNAGSSRNAPLEVVEKTPHEVPVDRYACADGVSHCRSPPADSPAQTRVRRTNDSALRVRERLWRGPRPGRWRHAPERRSTRASRRGHDRSSATPHAPRASRHRRGSACRRSLRTVRHPTLGRAGGRGRR